MGHGYHKVNLNERSYAKLGDRLYIRHTVDRMQPLGLGSPAGQFGSGRRISPTYIDDVIRKGTPRKASVDGVTRTVHNSGSMSVVTEQNIVIVVNPWGAAR